MRHRHLDVDGDARHRARRRRPSTTCSNGATSRLAAAPARDPPGSLGQLADRMLGLVEQHAMYGTTPLWRAWIEEQRPGCSAVPCGRPRSASSDSARPDAARGRRPARNDSARDLEARAPQRRAGLDAARLRRRARRQPRAPGPLRRRRARAGARALRGVGARRAGRLDEIVVGAELGEVVAEHRRELARLRVVRRGVAPTSSAGRAATARRRAPRRAPRSRRRRRCGTRRRRARPRAPP